jgi:hypothetical protein
VHRWVLINKHPSRNGTVVLRLPEAPSEAYANKTKTVRLLAKGADPLMSKTGITLGGYSYGAGAMRMGTQVTEYKEVRLFSNGTRQVSINVPAASAALVRLAKAASILPAPESPI